MEAYYQGIEAVGGYAGIPEQCLPVFSAAALQRILNTLEKDQVRYYRMKDHSDRLSHLNNRPG